MKKILLGVSTLVLATSAFARDHGSKIDELRKVIGESGISPDSDGAFKPDPKDWTYNNSNQTGYGIYKKGDPNNPSYIIEDFRNDPGGHRVQMVARTEGQATNAVTAHFSGEELISMTQCYGPIKKYGSNGHCATATNSICDYMRKSFGDSAGGIYKKVAECKEALFNSNFINGLKGLTLDRAEEESNRSSLRSITPDDYTRQPNPVLSSFPQLGGAAKDKKEASMATGFADTGFILEGVISTMDLCRKFDFRTGLAEAAKEAKKGH